MPEDYERVLNALKRAEERGLREMMLYKLRLKRMWLLATNFNRI